MTRLDTGIWEQLLTYLRANHRGINRVWFDQLQADDLEHGALTIHAADAGQLRYLQRYCSRAFTEGIQTITGRLLSVEFTCSDGDGAFAAEDAEDASEAFKRRDRLVRLNGDYSFDNLVVGPCNRLAHAACVAVSEAPGHSYNPLFVHGTVGLGKTHMLQAICHALLDHTPGAEVVYLTCETFVNEFIEAVEAGKLQEFRYQYRQADLLIIDDIQFLAGRERTQEEFFHTFNTLHQYKKQIVLSADCSPSDIGGLEERLTSRFNWGLVARVDPPCLETRNAILRKKAKLRGLDLAPEVTMHIASQVSANTRELEGVLNRLHGLAALEKCEPNMELAKAALGQTLNAAPAQIQIADIAGIVARRFSLKISDLQGKKRSRSIALPRQMAMYLCRRLTRHSLEEVGAYFGGRDHTTVLHANRLVDERRKQDDDMHKQLLDIENRLNRKSVSE